MLWKAVRTTCFKWSPHSWPFTTGKGPPLDACDAPVWLKRNSAHRDHSHSSCGCLGSWKLEGNFAGLKNKIFVYLSIYLSIYLYIYLSTLYICAYIYIYTPYIVKRVLNLDVPESSNTWMTTLGSRLMVTKKPPYLGRQSTIPSQTLKYMFFFRMFGGTKWTTSGQIAWNYGKKIRCWTAIRMLRIRKK